MATRANFPSRVKKRRELALVRWKSYKVSETCDAEMKASKIKNAQAQAAILEEKLKQFG